jgi:hypothetical protein
MKYIPYRQAVQPAISARKPPHILHFCEPACVPQP